MVGEGLVRSLGLQHHNMFVTTASWVLPEECIGGEELAHKMASVMDNEILHLCVAARLEPMKGVELAIEAMHLLGKRGHSCRPMLAILGEGRERERLGRMCERLGLGERVQFLGTRPYGPSFFSELRRHDLMVITNLSNEQPRIIFDALSQGVVPICPAHPAYSCLGIDSRAMYSPGNAASLASTIARVAERATLRDLVGGMKRLAREYTIKTMHEKRAEWIKRTCNQLRIRRG